MRERKPCPLCGAPADTTKVYVTSCTNNGCQMHAAELDNGSWNALAKKHAQLRADKADLVLALSLLVGLEDEEGIALIAKHKGS